MHGDQFCMYLDDTCTVKKQGCLQGEVLLQLLAPQQMDPVIAAQSVWVLHAMLSLPASREQMLAAHEVRLLYVRQESQFTPWSVAQMSHAFHIHA